MISLVAYFFGAAFMVYALAVDERPRPLPFFLGAVVFAVAGVLQLAGCTDDDELPRCADVGCPEVAVCRTDGVCSCPQDAGAALECRR